MSYNCFGKIVNLSYIKSNYSIYEFNIIINNIIDYEPNLMKYILNCIFTRYCNQEKLYYFNRRDLVLFITGIDCNNLVKTNQYGIISEDPHNIKKIHLPINFKYNYVINRLKYMIEKNVKLRIIEVNKYNNNTYPLLTNAIINDTKNAIINDTKNLTYKIYGNQFTIGMPSKDYLYQPQFIVPLIPIIVEWIKLQFPHFNLCKINNISNKILDSLKL